MTAFVSRRHASDLQLHESHSNDENLHFLQGTGYPKAIKKSLKTQILASFFRPFLMIFMLMIQTVFRRLNRQF
jgi:hypothetical protein